MAAAFCISAIDDDVQNFTFGNIGLSLTELLLGFGSRRDRLPHILMSAIDAL
jgi:hypothetical protein